MTQEEKQLLLKDLCARLPYEVKLDNGLKLRSIDVLTEVVSCTGSDRKIDCVKPYLRPMSSMTEEEKKEYDEISGQVKTFYGREAESHECAKLTNWLNKHHFDYRGMIENGLALEAPPEMYKNE